MIELLRNRVLEYLSTTAHQLDWVELRKLALAVGIEDDLEGVAPHEVHLEPCLDELVIGLRREDGVTFDIRVHFYGLDDAVRLRGNITSSISSIHALCWKERIYEYMVAYIQKESPTFSEECGLEISDLVRIPELARPLSLKLANLVPKGARRVHETTDTELLKGILMQDRRFDLKFHVQDDIHRRRASERASKYNEKRVTVLKRHHTAKDYRRTDFENEYAVMLTVDPIYMLRFAAISGKVSDSLEISTGGELGKVDNAGVCGCAAILYRKNIYSFTRDLAECEEYEVWRFRDTVGNYALRQVGEYRCLLAGLKLCANKGLFPLKVQGWSHQVNSHAIAMTFEEPDTSKFSYSELKRYKKPEPAYESHLCIPLFKEAKSLCDLIISTAREEHYGEPSNYNILGLPDARRTSNRPWKVSWAASDFLETGNGPLRPSCKVVPLQLRPASSEQGNREEKAQDRDADAPEESSAGPASAWEGRVTGTSLALSMTAPLLPPIIFERIHVNSPRYQDVMDEADKARTEGFMRDRGWTSKSYVGCLRDEDWTENIKFGR